MPQNVTPPVTNRYTINKTESNKKSTPNGVGAPEETPIPKKKRTPSGPAQEIVAAFCHCAGIDQPAAYPKAIGQAQLLANAGITPEDIPSLFASASWGDGADLGKMLASVDRWRSKKGSASAVYVKPAGSYGDWTPEQQAEFNASRQAAFKASVV